MTEREYEAAIRGAAATAWKPTPIGETAMKVVSKLTAIRDADKQAARIVASVLPAGLYPTRVTVVGDRVLIVVQTRADYERFKMHLPAIAKAVREGRCAAQAVTIEQEGVA